MSSAMKQFLDSSYLFGGNAPFVEELYESYLNNPQSVSDEWRAYFDKMQLLPAAGGGADEGRDVAHAPIVESFAQRAKQGLLKPSVTPTELGVERKQVYVLQLIHAYRFMGSRWADLDPLKRQQRPNIPELEPGYYDLTEADMETVFNTGTLVGPERMTLREILQALRETYCGSIGAEYMYISDMAQKRWIQQRLEATRGRPQFSAEQKKRILERLTAAETLEKYLHTRYVGQKRFSLEGGETVIPAMDEIVQRAGAHGVRGDGHRHGPSRPAQRAGEHARQDAQGPVQPSSRASTVSDLSAGDVKYHQGFSSDVSTPGGPLHLSLAFNPSHLEIVNPVVEGSVRARQHRRRDKEGAKIMSVLVHGDAAFAGQGVVMETLNLAQTRGYGTGGTVHIIVNNQIGFTTSDPRDSRSTLYCTDVAKMIEAPIFHVNGDDPEAAVFVTQLAHGLPHASSRRTWSSTSSASASSGHNEQDEPFVTQPLMYKRITQHPGTRKLYADKLVTQGVIRAEEPDQLVKDYRQALDEGRHTSSPVLSAFQRKYAVDWSQFIEHASGPTRPTPRCRSRTCERLGERLTTVPEGFKVHPAVERVMAARREMAAGKKMLDWGMGEIMAYATLLVNGYGVRLSGQDCGRGTFAHRHAVLHDQNREKWDAGSFVPLQNLAENQADFMVIDSVLSEEAVLGFEYGYACAEPNELVIWEAQFGDFANGAQVVIDQFITSGEAKWGRLCGLVHAAAARLRRAGAGALVGAPRALPAALRRAQHPGRGAVQPGADLPPAAPADAAQLPQAAGGDDAEVAAAQTRGGVEPQGPREGRVQDRHRRNRRARGEGRHAHRRLLGQGLLRPALRAARAPPRPHRHHPRRAALSVPAQAVRGRDEAVPERARSGVVPGRAAEPGRVVPDQALLRREHAQRPEAVLRGAAVVGVAGGGLCRRVTTSSRKSWWNRLSASSNNAPNEGRIRADIALRCRSMRRAVRREAARRGAMAGFGGAVCWTRKEQTRSEVPRLR